MEYECINYKFGQILIPIPCSYADCLELVRSDYFRYYGTMPSVSQVLLGMRRLNVCFSFWLRFSAYKEGYFYSLCHRMLNRYARKYGVHIEPQTKIGYGLYLSHCFGIIINPTAIIGNNVNLSQFTTIGSNEENAAIIGNDVYIGPNVCIVENVNIADRVTIGAGAVVVKDVPDNATVVGVPTHIVSYENPGRFICYKYVVER